MLRISGGQPPQAPPPPDAPPQLPPELAGQAPPPTPPQVDGGPRFSVQKVDPAVARYLGSESGPFECQGCQHWEEPNSCGIVSGDIDPQGVCCLFTKMEQEADPAGGGAEPPMDDTGGGDIAQG